MDIFDWFKQRRDRKKAEQQTNEFMRAFALIEQAQHSTTLFEQIELVNTFLQLVGKSEQRDIYDIKSAKQIVVESVSKFLARGGDLDRRQLGLAQGCGSSLRETLEETLGITKENVEAYRKEQFEKQQVQLYKKIKDSVKRKGWYSSAYDFDLFRKYTTIPHVQRKNSEDEKTVAYFALSFLEKMFFPERFKVRDELLAGSDQTITIYDTIKKIVDVSIDETVLARKFPLYEKVNKKLDHVTKRLEKEQDKLHFKLEGFAHAGDKRYHAQRGGYIIFSRTFSKLLDENAESICAQVQKLDANFKTASAHQSSSCQNQTHGQQ